MQINLESENACLNDMRQAYKDNRLDLFVSALYKQKEDLDKFFTRYLEHKSVIKAMDKFLTESPEWVLYRKKLNQYSIVSKALLYANYLQHGTKL